MLSKSPDSVFNEILIVFFDFFKRYLWFFILYVYIDDVIGPVKF